MPSIDVVIESPISRSMRVRQLEGMFDVPAQEKMRLEWKAELPLDEKPWNVGLIVGPSGSGKSTIARHLYGKDFDKPPRWGADAVIDDFAKDCTMGDIAAVCQAVGFNTVPAWMRPYSALSNGERFRVELARRMLETRGPIVVDEFTSVVDRQVAKIASHAVQKWARKNERQFVAVTCHYDVEEWLQPEWVLDVASMHFRWRSLQRRPQLQAEIIRVDRKAWKLFAPYHYMSADLHKGAQCFCLLVDDQPVSFAAVLFRPGGKTPVYGLSRVVTLPDWQGLGNIFQLADTVGGIYKAAGKRLRAYPAHPALVRSVDRNPSWRLVTKGGQYSHNRRNTHKKGGTLQFGGRQNFTFEYCGPAADQAAVALVS